MSRLLLRIIYLQDEGEKDTSLFLCYVWSSCGFLFRLLVLVVTITSTLHQLLLVAITGNSNSSNDTFARVVVIVIRIPSATTKHKRNVSVWFFFNSFLCECGRMTDLQKVPYALMFLYLFEFTEN